MIVHVQTGYHVSANNGMAIINTEHAHLAYDKLGFVSVTPREATRHALAWRASRQDIERITQREVLEVA